MGHGLSFRIRGIPVRIEVTFLLVAVLLGLGARSGALLVTWVLIVTGSVLLHELGHAVAFRWFGQSPSIVLQGMGGLTSAHGALSPRRDLVVSLVGPLTGLLLLGLPALWLGRSSEGLSTTEAALLTDVVWVNLAWSVLNLLPVLPLDGGRVSAALFSLATKGDGLRPAHLVSAVVAAAAGLFAYTQGYVFGALFAGFFLAMNVGQLTAGRNQGLAERLDQGWAAMRTGDVAGGAQAAQGVLADRPSAQVMARATELLAWSRLAGGDAAGARATLARFPSGHSPDPFLLAALDLDASETGAALDHVVAGYQAGGQGPAPHVLADALARSGLAGELTDRLLAPGGPGAAAAARFAVHLHGVGHYAEAVAAGERALASSDDGGRGEIAYNLACSHARAGHGDAALDWLARAGDLGFADTALVDGDPDLDDLRTLDRFRTVRDRLERP
ncbi:MAG: hypothetical protein AB1673_09120 [Actinomycetota bacterium]